MVFGSSVIQSKRLQLILSDSKFTPRRPSFGKDFDLRFSVFGPEYSTRRAKIEIAGFADGSLFPPEDLIRKLTLLKAARYELLRLIKLKQLKKYDGFIVETSEMATKLREWSRGSEVWVVPNAPRNVYFEPDQEASIQLPPKAHGELRLFYPARGHDHKNHKFIPLIANEYYKVTGLRLRVVTTLRPLEIKSLGLFNEESLINAGEISSKECASLMRVCDGVLFPSLNETCSVTPLESLASERILFASNRDFVRQIMQDGAVYFDPINAMDAARKISAFKRADNRREFVLANRSRRQSLWTQSQRTDAYLDVIKKLLKV